MIKNAVAYVKRNFWPISAIIFCPCHLPLTMSVLVSLTAGTALGALISAHYSSIETVLAVSFSFYFVLAFMIWVVRGPRANRGKACAIDTSKTVSGLSTRQIVLWGVIGVFTMPALIAVSAFTRQSYFAGTIGQILTIDASINSGFIWLVSIATVVMIPVMVIWLVWLWLAWYKTDFSRTESAENWSYEYD